MVKDLLSALWSGNWQGKEDAKGNFKLNTKGFPDSGCVALSSSLAGKRRKPHCWKHESLLKAGEILSWDKDETQWVLSVPITVNWETIDKAVMPRGSNQRDAVGAHKEAFPICHKFCRVMWIQTDSEVSPEGPQPWIFLTFLFLSALEYPRVEYSSLTHSPCMDCSSQTQKCCPRLPWSFWSVTVRKAIRSFRNYREKLIFLEVFYFS